MNKIFVKLINGVLIYAPNSTMRGNTAYSGSAYTDSLKREDGFKEYLKIVEPEAVNGVRYIHSYKETDSYIKDVYERIEDIEEAKSLKKAEILDFLNSITKIKVKEQFNVSIDFDRPFTANELINVMWKTKKNVSEVFELATVFFNDMIYHRTLLNAKLTALTNIDSVNNFNVEREYEEITKMVKGE